MPPEVWLIASTSVRLTAPGNSSVLRWRATSHEPLESVQIRLAASLVEEASRSLSAPFPDVLQLDDPYVAATGQAIAVAVRRRAPAVYADALAYSLATHLELPGHH